MKTKKKKKNKKKSRGELGPGLKFLALALGTSMAIVGYLLLKENKETEKIEEVDYEVIE